MTEWRAYGLAEIAEAIGQKPEVVRVWYSRGKLPPPRQVLKMGPLWLVDDIEPWIAVVQAIGGRPMPNKRGPKPQEPRNGSGRPKQEG